MVGVIEKKAGVGRLFLVVCAAVCCQRVHAYTAYAGALIGWPAKALCKRLLPGTLPTVEVPT